ncbi:serine/threonine protein kinase [Planctomycetaceae bacterium SH139]
MQDPGDPSEPTRTFVGHLSELPGSFGDHAFPVISNYTIQACIGMGAFGCVYRAERKSDQAIVAIKVLQPRGQLTDAIRARFLREATLLCQLNHPHIVPFRELGITGEQLYLVMEYVDAVSWRSLSQNMGSAKRLSIVFGIIARCLNALVYLHEKGMVHRDLKPSNLLIEKRDKKLHVFLADFGLAKDYLQAGHSGVTSDNEIAGTLSYLAPELLAGVKYYLPESDQYALAATCYDMLSGRPPIIMNSSASALALIRSHHVPRIESLVPEVPKTLADWLHRGLSTEPGKRFSSTFEMQRSLRILLRRTT